MAEALAIIGLVSSIAQFVQFGGQVVERLNEFSSDLHEVPQTFQAIKVQLPLLVDTLNRTQRQANAGYVSDETAVALRPLVDACSTEIKVIEAILKKNLPSQRSSNWERRLLALKSLAHDKEMDRSIAKLESYIRLLTFHQSTSNLDGFLVLRKSLQSRKPIFMVPFDPDETFVGRKDILETIDRKINTSRRRAVLTGIGGVGKSQIAIQHCYQYRSRQPDSHVFWVHCGSIARFDQGYREIARKLELPGIQDPGMDVAKTVFDWLSDEDNGSWLLVLDNADDQEMFFGSGNRSTQQDILKEQLGRLVQYLPRSAHGSTLITTRDRRVGERFAERDKPIIVLPLEAEDAKSMLFSRLSDHLDGREEEVLELLDSLQYLPLAIAQAASYISEEGVTISRYLELLRPGNADSKALLEQDYYDSTRHTDIHNSVFQTWKLSFDQIRQQMPRAAEILSLMCMLDKQSISRKLLQDEEESQIILDKAFATLKNFSLIYKEKSQQTYQIHRLVQLSTQWWLEQEKTLKKWQKKALDVLIKHCPSSDSVEHWKAWESISPHIVVVQAYHFEEEEQRLQYADITSRTGGYNEEIGRYEVASKMQAAALTIQREILGNEHPDTLTNMNNLALVLDRQAKYELAEEMHQEVLRLRKTISGEEHPGTLTSMNNLASVLHDQGKYEQAEEMHREALRSQKAVLGEEHPDTLISMSNLALVLHDQGKYEQAEEMHREVLRLRKTVLGEEHPDTLTSMNNLALVLRCQGKYEQAEEMHREVLRLCKTVLGEEHPNTLMSMNNLAPVLRCQGKYEQAEEMHREALRLCKTVLGKEHPNTLMSMSNLALVLRCQGKYEQAEEMHREVLRLCKTVLSEEHPDTLMSMSNLALVLRCQGKYEQAEEMHREALRLCKTVLGEENPDTLASMNNLALVFQHQRRLEEAEQLGVKVTKARTMMLGLEHPDTLTSTSNLALVFRDQGRLREAEQLEMKVMKLRTRVLGLEHPDTLTSMNNLALVFRDQGRLEEAEQLEVKVMELRTRVLGLEHPDTLMSTSNLASIFRRQGRLGEVEQLEVKVIEARTRALGLSHPDTLTSIANLTET